MFPHFFNQMSSWSVDDDHQHHHDHDHHHHRHHHYYQDHHHDHHCFTCLYNLKADHLIRPRDELNSSFYFVISKEYQDNRNIVTKTASWNEIHTHFHN